MSSSGTGGVQRFDHAGIVVDDLELVTALRRLEAKGLVKALDGTGEPTRHHRVYEPTQADRAAHAT